MFPLISATSLIIVGLFVVCFAEDCHPGSVRECLDRFDQIIASCGEDVDCQCDALWTSGVNCFGTCPEDAKAHFVRNFRNNECSDQAWKSLEFSPTSANSSSYEDLSFASITPSHTHTDFTWKSLDYSTTSVDSSSYKDPGSPSSHTHKDQSEPVAQSATVTEAVPQLPGAKLRRWLNQLSLDSTKTNSSKTSLTPTDSRYLNASIRASVTAMQQPQSSWSIEEETRRKQLQRMKENLQSIRSSRARESSLARLAAEALTSSITPTETTPVEPQETTRETTSTVEHAHESSASSYFEVHLIAIALFLLCLNFGLPAF